MSRLMLMSGAPDRRQRIADGSMLTPQAGHPEHPCVVEDYGARAAEAAWYRASKALDDYQVAPSA
jgi:hypothetical protein